MINQYVYSNKLSIFFQIYIGDDIIFESFIPLIIDNIWSNMYGSRLKSISFIFFLWIIHTEIEDMKFMIIVYSFNELLLVKVYRNKFRSSIIIIIHFFFIIAEKHAVDIQKS